jgi:hypothetical protein
MASLAVLRGQGSDQAAQLAPGESDTISSYAKNFWDENIGGGTNKKESGAGRQVRSPARVLARADRERQRPLERFS